MNGPIAFAVMSSFRPSDEEMIEEFFRVAKNLRTIITEYAGSSALVETDRAWCVEALSQRKRLFDVATRQNDLLVELIQHLHDEWQFDFTMPLENGLSILHLVCRNKNTAALRLLLSYGLKANMSVSHEESLTKGSKIKFATRPLHIAAENNDVEGFKLLLSHGADLEVYNEHKLSPLGIALIAGNTEIITLCLGRINLSQAHIEWVKANHCLHPDALLLEKYFAFRAEFSQFITRLDADEGMLKAIQAKYPGQSLNLKAAQLHGFKS